MDLSSRDGAFVAVWSTTFADKGKYTIWNTALGRYCGCVPGSTSLLDIQWPFVVTARYNQLCVYVMRPRNIIKCKDRISMQVSDLGFVAPRKLVVVWKSRDGKRKWWGLWIIDNKVGLVLARSGPICPNVTVAAASPRHLKLSFGRECCYYNIWTKEETQDLNVLAKSALQPIAGTGSQTTMRIGYKRTLRFTHWDHRLKVIDDESNLALLDRIVGGWTISRDRNTLVMRNRTGFDHTNNRVTYRFVRHDLLQYIGPNASRKRMGMLLKRKGRFKDMFDAVHTMMPLPLDVVYDIMLHL
jgi:hypothetical protein